MKPETVISLLALNNSLLEKCFIEMAIADSAQAQLYSDIARKYRENKALLNNLEVRSGLLLEPETRQCFENFVREMTTKILSQDLSKKELQAPVDFARPKLEMVVSEKKPSILGRIKEMQSAQAGNAPKEKAPTKDKTSEIS